MRPSLVRNTKKQISLVYLLTCSMNSTFRGIVACQEDGPTTANVLVVKNGGVVVILGCPQIEMIALQGANIIVQVCCSLVCHCRQTPQWPLPCGLVANTPKIAHIQRHSFWLVLSDNTRHIERKGLTFTSLNRTNYIES